MENEYDSVIEIVLLPETENALDEEKAGVIPTDAMVSDVTPVLIKKEGQNDRLHEIIALRKENRKVFQMTDGSQQAVFYPECVHVYNEDNRMYDAVETAIVEDDDGKHYRSGKTQFVAKFNREDDNEELFAIENGMHRVAVYAKRNKKQKNKSVTPKLRNKGMHHLGEMDCIVFEEIQSGTDYSYSVTGNGVKESIVVKERGNVYRYAFILEYENVTARFDEENKHIVFISNEHGEEVFYIPAPFMVDDNGVESSAVDYELKQMDDGRSTFIITADSAWMNMDERAFPVVIDPQIMIKSSSAMTTYSWDNGYMYSASQHKIGTICENNATTCCAPNRMYMTLHMPALPHNPRVKKAELKFIQAYGNNETGDCNKIGLYQVNGEICAGYCTPNHELELIDFAKMQAGDSKDGAQIHYTFDVTALFDQMIKGESDTPRLVLKKMDESCDVNNYISFYGSANNGANAPQLVVTYESSYGVNASYRAHTHALGRYGQASIDLQCGNLMFDAEDFAWAGNRMPVTIKHLYNSALSAHQYTANSAIKLETANFAAMKIGHGFKLNIMQSMIHLDNLPVAFTEEELNDANFCTDGYVYIGENGEETYFKMSKQSCCKKDDQCYYLYKDVDGGELQYDPVNRTLTQGQEVYQFDVSGRLVSITDSSKNKMCITYTANRISSVTDGAGRDFGFSYSNGVLQSIEAPNKDTICFEYDSNNLACIIYPDNRRTQITYTAGKPSAVTLQDEKGNNVYKVEYTYNGDRVSSVTEYGVENNHFVEGAKSTYSYSVASGRTIVETIEPKDVDEGETADEVIKTVYTFDDDGNVVGEYAYVEETGNVGVEGGGGGINPYAGDNGTAILLHSDNLLRSHNFENLAFWTEMACNCSDLDVSSYANEGNAQFGTRVLRLNSQNAGCAKNGVYQVTNILPAGQYTFSAYTRVVTSFTGTDTPGIYIRVTTTDGAVLAESEHIAGYDERYNRLIAPFTLEDAQSVLVQILVDGKGVAYADGAQLEKNPYANVYNMLENSSFEWNTGWECFNANFSTEDAFNGDSSVKMVGDVHRTCYASQEVMVHTARETRETFTLSGWAKGYGLPTHERNGIATPTFRLRAVVYYNDSGYHDYSTEEFTADFSPCTEEWQFASVQFSKNKYRTVRSIRVYCDYSHNFGVAYFDNIQLVRDSRETGVTVSGFEGDVAGDSTTTPATQTAPAFEEAKDKYGNIITETTFSDGEFGTIYRAFDFDCCCNEAEDAGNNLVREFDARGAVTEYDVDDDTSRNEVVTDRCGNKTFYEYDEAGRTTKVTSKDAADQPFATVSYTYDAYDNMTGIIRGDGMKYALAYNAFHNMESIGIDGKSEKLVTYSYKNGNGRLKQITYANGDYMKASYNTAGQMVAERWYNADDALTAHYRYTYDGEGNIVRSVDICAEKEYNYFYEEGKLLRATESDIVLSGDAVVGKTVVSQIKYYYNSDGDLSYKVISADGVSRTIWYETVAKKGIAQFVAGSRLVTSHSKTDSFGRKIFDELQLGRDFVSRQFSYQAGAVPTEHKDNYKVKSTATTNLVSQIQFSGGRAISYEYDNEERITRISDSVDGVFEYTYDALGQLLEEKVNDTVVNTMTYDNYGNIATKNGVVYTYGDGVWKDKLTAYGDKTITYDAQGNPLNYMGHYLTWEKGRQLKSFDSNTYTYNANGIRTSKTVNGVKHEYLLDGTMILHETWDGNTLVPLYDDEDFVCGIQYNGTDYYFHKNLQGDVIAIVDAYADVVARYTYDAWGVCTITFDQSSVGIATVNPYRYRSYYYDNESKLYYLQSRYYNPQNGKFLNFDSAGYINYTGTVISNNLSCYCENSPVNGSDYFGHSWFNDRIINKIKEYAQKAVNAVEEAVEKVVVSVKQTVKSTAKVVEKAVKTAGGAIAKKAAKLVVKGISKIATGVKPEYATEIYNIRDHVLSTIDNETALDFWNIYCEELFVTVAKELKPIASFTWESIKNAVVKCWKNKNFSSLDGDWKSYIANVKKMLLGMTESVNKVLEIYNNMSVNPLSLDQSNKNFKKNNDNVLNKKWYKYDSSSTYKYIKDQGSSVLGLVSGDEYSLKDSGCGLIASYNVGKYFDRNVDLPAIIYWYEQNSGFVLGSLFGVNPYKIPEFLDMINLKCKKYDTIEALENTKSTTNGVYIVCQWNDATNITEAAHMYMVEDTGSQLIAYNNNPSAGNTFADLVDKGLLICAYRIYE